MADSDIAGKVISGIERNTDNSSGDFNEIEERDVKSSARLSRANTCAPPKLTGHVTFSTANLPRNSSLQGHTEVPLPLTND